MGHIPSTVAKPSRYSGCEIRRPLVPWEEAKVRILLAFPDVYEIGMSHLGLLLLHEILNARAGTRAERVFAPWPDLEAHLRERGDPLRSLESGTPARRFDVVGFSLCYELTYTNVLSMLSLAGIPLLRGERTEDDPVVLGGGICTLNPAPVAPFFDALLVGDGEEAVLEIAAAVEERRKCGADRPSLVARLASIEGVYVPGVSRGATRRVLADLNRSPLLPDPILPAMRVVHDRLSVEISRGCTRGCRFCQAGYAYRPVRERDPRLLLDYLREVAPKTGYDEIGLLSLSVADYGCIDRLVAEAMDTLSPERIAVSLPSLRLDALKEDTARQIRKVRKTGFTLAPEASTERLRRSVNKDIRDEDIDRTADFIFGSGWQTLKHYFMVGLPGETEADVRAIGEIVRRTAATARRHGRRNTVTASVTAFVPKPHTPFQWERQISREELLERIGIIRAAAGRERNAEIKYHAPEVSELEGAFSRGDERLARVRVRAWAAGARVDGWTESFRADLWKEAFAAEGVDPARLRDARDPAAPLPWDVVDAGVDRAFLLEERDRARAGTTTPDCRKAGCASCGACRPGLSNVLYEALPGEPASGEAEGPAAPAGAPGIRFVLRIRYAKEGPARHLSGLELQSLWIRALRRAGMPVAYSQGFHPQPKLSFSPALPVGTESEAEFLETELRLPVDAASASAALRGALPEGIAVAEIRGVPPGTPRLSDYDIVCTYRILPLDGTARPEDLRPADVDRAWNAFLASPSFPLSSGRDGRTVEVDIRGLVTSLRVNGGGLSVTIIPGTGRGVRPLDAARAILGIPLPPDGVLVRKVEAELVPRRAK